MSETYQRIVRNIRWWENFFRNTPAGFEYTDAQLMRAYGALSDGEDSITVSDNLQKQGCSHWPGQKRCEVCGMGVEK